MSIPRARPCQEGIFFPCFVVCSKITRLILELKKSKASLRGHFHLCNMNFCNIKISLWLFSNLKYWWINKKCWHQCVGSLLMTKNRLPPCRPTGNVESKLMMWLVLSYLERWSFFLLPTLFSFLGFDIHAQPLKIQLYLPVCIYVKFGPHYFDSICSDFDTFWIFFLLISFLCIFFHLIFIFNLVLILLIDIF